MSKAGMEYEDIRCVAESSYEEGQMRFADKFQPSVYEWVLFILEDCATLSVEQIVPSLMYSNIFAMEAKLQHSFSETISYFALRNESSFNRKNEDIRWFEMKWGGTLEE